VFDLPGQFGFEKLAIGRLQGDKAELLAHVPQVMHLEVVEGQGSLSVSLLISSVLTTNHI
jgi:hypothetical protein